MTTVSDLFDLSYGHSLEFNQLTPSVGNDGINFVSRTARNNGVSGRVAFLPDVRPAPAGTITVALNGQGGAGAAFLQPYRYYTGFHVMVLTAKKPMSDREKLWWVYCLTANRFRFGFGRQANKTLASLQLPDPGATPNWVSKGGVVGFSGADAPVIRAKVELPPIGQWSLFKYTDLFEIKKGDRLTKIDMINGETPFIGSIDKNNGYRQFISARANHAGNTITVNYNGSVAEAFYQPKEFWASDDVNVLYPKFLCNPYIGMFLCALIRKEKFRFNYGRKWNLERMNDSTIFLPSNADQSPDWQVMEDYIKSLAFSSAI